VNFRECIHKIALSRSIFQPKMHQIAFTGRDPPGPAGELTALPQTICIEWSLLLREWDGKRVDGGKKRRGVGGIG